MSDITAERAELSTSRRSRSPTYEAWQRFRRGRLGMLGLVIVLVLIVVAIAGPALAPYDPLTPDLEAILEGPSGSHLMGTDDLGRDIFSRVVHGARFAFIEGAVVLVISMSLGILLGAVAGYYTKLETIFTRLMEILLAYPGLLLALGIVAIVGPGLPGALLAVGVGGIAPTAVLTRSVVRSLAKTDYVVAARQVGCSERRILFVHILPNSFSPLIVQGTFRIAIAILTVAALSFLGLGAQQPTPEWGSMLSSGRDLILGSPHVALFPGLALAITVLAFNLLGDGLRDSFDPRFPEGARRS